MTLSPSVAKILKEDEDETTEERLLREAEERAEKDVSMGELGEQELTEQELEAGAQVEDDELSPVEEKFVRKIQTFGKQVDLLVSNLAIKKKQGTDYKIYSTNKNEPTLFPFIASAKMFNDFLTFVNSCFTMKADEEMPKEYFPTGVLKYFESNDEEAQGLKREIIGICEDARDFAEKKYVDKNGFEVVVLAYEKTYDARYLTSKGREEQASAFKDIIQFLKTGKQPRYEVDKAIGQINEMASEVSKLSERIADERDRFSEKLDSSYFAEELKTKLRQETATLVGSSSEKINEYMEGLPDDLRNKVIFLYEQEVVPKVKQEIEDVKAGKKGSLRQSTTEKRKEEIENLQAKIDANEAKLKNLGKNKVEELRNEIAEAREKLEAWRKRNLTKDKSGKIDPKKTKLYMRRQNNFDKLVSQKTGEIANVKATLSQEIAELEGLIQQDRKRLTDKKIKLSSRRKEVTRREGVSGTLEQLNDMLDATRYNDQHVRILRIELMEQYVDEELEEELANLKEEFNESEKKLVMQQGRYAKVEKEIKDMSKASRQLNPILEEVDKLASKQLEGRSLSKVERENLSLGRATLRTFVSVEQSITDIVGATEKLLKQYESMSEYIKEALQAFSFEEKPQELQDDIEEEMSDSEKIKNKLRIKIDKEMEVLADKMDKLQANLELYKSKRD